MVGQVSGRTSSGLSRAGRMAAWLRRRHSSACRRSGAERLRRSRSPRRHWIDRGPPGCWAPPPSPSPSPACSPSSFCGQSTRKKSTPTSCVNRSRANRSQRWSLRRSNCLPKSSTKTRHRTPNVSNFSPLGSSPCLCRSCCSLHKCSCFSVVASKARARARGRPPSRGSPRPQRLARAQRFASTPSPRNGRWTHKSLAAHD